MASTLTRKELAEALRELQQNVGELGVYGMAFAMLAEKLDPPIVAPEGYEFLLDDEGKRVKRLAKDGEWYLTSWGEALRAKRDHQNVPYHILIPIDPPAAEFEVGSWVQHADGRIMLVLGIYDKRCPTRVHCQSFSGTENILPQNLKPLSGYEVATNTLAWRRSSLAKVLKQGLEAQARVAELEEGKE